VTSRWTIVYFKNSALLAPIISGWERSGCAMESTRYVMVGLVVIILACMAIFVGTYAAELIGIVPAR
jgi:hypothetical protein